MRLVAIAAALGVLAACSGEPEKVGGMGMTREAAAGPEGQAKPAEPDAPPPAGIAASAPWSGSYLFTEAGAADSGQVLGYKLTFLPATGTPEPWSQDVEIDIDGFQTMSRLKAKVRDNGGRTEIVFDSYRPENAGELYAPGDLLFTLDRKDGKVTTTWGKMTPQLDMALAAAGEHFKPM